MTRSRMYFARNGVIGRPLCRPRLAHAHDSLTPRSGFVQQTLFCERRSVWSGFWFRSGQKRVVAEPEEFQPFDLQALRNSANAEPTGQWNTNLGSNGRSTEGAGGVLGLTLGQG